MRRTRRRIGLVLLLVLLPAHVAVASPRSPAASVAAPVVAAPVVVAPVVEAAAPDGSGRVPPLTGGPVRAFEAPAHDYGPGHRGVDLPAVPGQVVRAPAAGTVTFTGPVAGRGVVVVEHAGGTLTSLEPVEAVVPRGAAVEAGAPVAVVVSGTPHAGCPEGCLHWGVRVAGRYVDPWWWLGLLGPVRLLPWLQSPFDLPRPDRTSAPAGASWVSAR